MTGVGLVLSLLGYWVLYYGLDQITGGNDGFLDIGVPGKFAGAAKRDEPPPKCPGIEKASTKAASSGAVSGAALVGAAPAAAPLPPTGTLV